MGKYTREEILRMAEDEDVEFIRLQFTDMFGILKNIAITFRELPRALNNRCVVDGAYIAGVGNGVEAEVYLYPDLDTFEILPWRPQQGKVARMLCDIYHSDGTPCESSPRYILKRMVKKAREQGYTFYFKPECEFFLFHTDDNGLPTTVTHEQAGYLDTSPLDLGENARRDMVLTLEDMGFEIVSSHHETAPAQHEIDFCQGEAQEIADGIMTFKVAVRTVAKRHGLHATFMPKPKPDVNGSGMHIKMSIFKNGKNILADQKDSMGLSEEGYSFVAGLLSHSREMTAITNPLVNSYKRLVPGYEAPTEIIWSRNAPDALLRVPSYKSGEHTQVELRSPDGAANPYLLFACCIAAGLEGIEKKLTPSQYCSEKALSQITEEERKEMKIDSLPCDLKDAIAVMEQSAFMEEVLGTEFFHQYIAARKKEWEEYSKQVTQWELDKYLLGV
ncbi:MAG: glutamine synthetase family protein [Eubacteriales bacterium]|nr:glutamine synthetase family protein [Eubacteriales bacterium]